jgi:hypothetical protein
MPISPHLIRKLLEALGDEAPEDLVSQLEHGDQLRADVAELRHEMQLGFARVDARFAAFDEKFAGIDQKFAAIDQRLDLKVDGLRMEIREQVAGATAKLLKWSFVFWVSAVGAIAGLAGVLR